MTRDQELWATASMLLRQHGERAPMKVAERIGELAAMDETEGVALWQQLARRLDALIVQRHKA